MPVEPPADVAPAPDAPAGPEIIPDSEEAIAVRLDELEEAAVKDDDQAGDDVTTVPASGEVIPAQAVGQRQSLRYGRDARSRDQRVTLQP